jgi:hypothetical protein
MHIHVQYFGNGNDIQIVKTKGKSGTSNQGLLHNAYGMLPKKQGHNRWLQSLDSSRLDRDCLECRHASTSLVCTVT